MPSSSPTTAAESPGDPALRHALDRAGRRVPLVWDPHPRGADPVASTLVVTPNASEAEALGASVGDGVAQASEAARQLAAAWSVPAVLLTLGERGAVLHEPQGVAAHVMAATEVGVADACGAGDSLAGALAVALADGEGIVEAAETAVGRRDPLPRGGRGPLARRGRPAVRCRWASDIDALTLATDVRARGGVVVATGGCFDLLHAGHARTLSAARRLGDCLIVCLNSDASVRRLKGRQRPIIGEDDRRELLLALECVDAVMVFDEDTPEAVLERIRPDIWVKGGDYRPEDLPETALLQTWGGRTVTVPFHPARSTTGLATALARVG